MRHLLHAAAFQGVWFACVLGGAAGLWWPGLVSSGVLVLLCLLTSPARAAESRLVLGAALLGVTLDSLLAATSLLEFAAPLSPRLAPPWIVCLWAAFATLAPRSLSGLRGRPWLAAGLGAAAGPVTYLSAASMGAAELLAPLPVVALAVALEYSLAMPLVMRLAASVRPADVSSAG